MPRSPLTTVLCLSLLLLCGMGLTIVSFFALIVPEDRGPTFYVVLASLCAAEAVLFGYLAYFATVPHSVKRPSPAVRMRILVLVIIWFLIVLCTGIFAVHPGQADTFFSDKIIIWPRAARGTKARHFKCSEADYNHSLAAFRDEAIMTGRW